MSELLQQAGYCRADDLLDSWKDDLLTGKKPILYPVGEGELARIQIGPGLVTLIGGAPGAGKTAFVMQCVLNTLRAVLDLKALVCNVEMTPAVLLDRQLSRFSGIDLSVVRQRDLGKAHADRLAFGFDALLAISERLAFLKAPFGLDNVAASADAFGAGLIVLDYIQRFKPSGEHGDKRAAVNSLMDHLRQFADAGAAVIVVAALSRGKDAKGRVSYAADNLSLASFRESSELEFGCDSAFILAPSASDPESVTLMHLKDRNGEPKDISLHFDRSLQRFNPSNAPASSKPKARKGKAVSTAHLTALWAKTPTAGDNQEAEGDAL
jgi:replicative DNA helicase